MPQLQFHYCLFHPRAPLFSFIKFLVQRSSQTHRVCPNVYPNSNRANFFFFLTPSHLSSEVFGFQRLKSHWDTHTHTHAHNTAIITDKLFLNLAFGRGLSSITTSSAISAEYCHLNPPSDPEGGTLQDANQSWYSICAVPRWTRQAK